MKRFLAVIWTALLVVGCSSQPKKPEDYPSRFRMPDSPTYTSAEIESISIGQKFQPEYFDYLVRVDGLDVYKLKRSELDSRVKAGRIKMKQLKALSVLVDRGENEIVGFSMNFGSYDRLDYDYLKQNVLEKIAPTSKWLSHGALYYGEKAQYPFTDFTKYNESGGKYHDALFSGATFGQEYFRKTVTSSTITLNGLNYYFYTGFHIDKAENQHSGDVVLSSYGMPLHDISLVSKRFKSQKPLVYRNEFGLKYKVDSFESTPEGERIEKYQGDRSIKISLPFGISAFVEGVEFVNSKYTKKIFKSVVNFQLSNMTNVPYHMLNTYRDYQKFYADKLPKILNQSLGCNFKVIKYSVDPDGAVDKQECISDGVKYTLAATFFTYETGGALLAKSFHGLSANVYLEIESI